MNQLVREKVGDVVKETVLAVVMLTVLNQVLCSQVYHLHCRNDLPAPSHLVAELQVVPWDEVCCVQEGSMWLQEGPHVYREQEEDGDHQDLVPAHLVPLAQELTC